MDVIYVGQSIDLNWSIRRNASEVLEDFSRADLKVFLTGNDFDGNYDGKYYFANHIDEQGRVVLDIDPGSLTPGTYCIEGIWIKNSHELLNSGWTRSISRARKDRIFKVSDVESECTDYDEEAGHVVAESHEINIATGTTSYGYDGMSAYETAIFNGSTAKTEKEWIDTYEKAEDRVNYEMDESHDGSVPGEPQSWANAELKRKQAEGQLGDTDPYYSTSRRKKESDRQTAETARATAEDSRQEYEGQGDYSDTTAYPNTRRAKEAARQTAETGRAEAESGRVSAETTRVQNEGSGGPSSTGYSTSRIKNELDRQAAESQRQTNEGIGDTDAECAAGSRRKNESIRQANEATRQAQEGSATDEPSASGSRWARYKYNEGTDADSEAGDDSRWGKFKEQEGTLDSSEADDGSRWGQYKEEEGTEDSSYIEHSRWGNYQAAEISRGNDYSEAEGSADGSTSGDGSRWGSYKQQEGANTDAASASGTRWARYKNAEAARDALYAAAEAARDEAIAPAIGIYDCDTAAATADKTVSASDYILASGGAIKIKFQYANSAASPTLEINSQGAKAIVFNGAVASASNTWGAGEVVEFYYDPTYNSNAGGYIGRSTVVSVSQNSLTIGGDYKGELSTTYDVTLHNSGATFASLEALLSDENLSTLIPPIVRKGGMNIKFVQNSDNKYVQYRLMAASWSINTDDWAIADEGVYVENPEFVYVKTDNEDKILWAIKKDGGIYYGAGCPQQVKDYIEEKISSLSLDEYEDIVAFLNDYLGSDTTLKVMIDGINAAKVDKVEGKSLIDAEYASTKSTMESPEFIEVTTDSEDKVLEGIQQDGTKVISGDLNVGGSSNINGDIRVLGNMEVSGVSYKVIKNPEYLAAWLDAENKVIFGFKVDGKTYVGDADFLNEINNNKEAIAEIETTLATIGAKVDSLDIDALTSITTVNNPEFIEEKTDSEGKLLAGRTPDGVAFEKVGFSSPVVSTSMVSVDGHILENIEDREERSEIIADSEGRIVAYRDSNGVKHENVGIKIHGEGLTDLAKDLQQVGTGTMNWSDEKELHIEEPKCARVNFSGIANIPQAKLLNVHGYMEFWDMQGNYFKKEVIMNAQGRSSLGHPKKNIAIDICNNNGWDDEDTFKLQIGDWVPQDSFHLKGYYNDPFKCVCPITYKYYDEIVKTDGVCKDYAWKRSLIDLSSITSTSNGSSTLDDTKLQFDTGARCFPLGFPCIVYLNGEFYGIYSWQLKKHRDVYHMKKTNKKHIHLDGMINNTTLFGANGDGSQIVWTETNPEGFEVRNPKGLVYAEAHTNSKGNATYKYDADDPGCQEIAGNNDGSSTYDTWVAGSYAVNKIVTLDGHQFINTVEGNNKVPTIDSSKDLNTDKSPDFKNKTKCGWINCTMTVAVKKAIIELSTVMSKLDNAASVYEASSKTAEDLALLKTEIEKYFDVDNIIEYLIISDVLRNADGWGLNWQWFTYDAKKWFIGVYDCDAVLGNFTSNDTIMPPNTTHFRYRPALYIITYYEQELNAKYKQLRDSNLISTEHIVGLVRDWLNRLGNVTTFEKEWEKWPGFVKNDSIMRLEKWLDESISNMDDVYSYNQN